MTMTLNDLIKRGTELRNYAQERADNHDEEKWRDYYAGQVGGLSAMLNALKEAVTANNNGWISVDERLPVEWETVLLNTDDGVQVGTLELSANGENFFINDCDDGTMVYHWQPLPPAPEQAK